MPQALRLDMKRSATAAPVCPYLRCTDLHSRARLDHGPLRTSNGSGPSARLAGFKSMETPRGIVERRQRVLRVARETLDTVGLPNELDETFYESLRAALVSAGATDADLDEVATLLVTWIVESTEPDSADRFEQFDLIGHHLVCTDMQIEIGPEDTDVHVEFPRRPKIH